MTRYIALLRFTQKGAMHITDSTSRVHEFDTLAKKAGVKIEGHYWTIGAYDGVLVVTAESEKKALSLFADLAADGHVRTQTMQAFTGKEFEKFVN